jgi:hypothetical protein
VIHLGLPDRIGEAAKLVGEALGHTRDYGAPRPGPARLQSLGHRPMGSGAPS